ncbi:MAG: CGNR zinc finger domain-containing protein [Nitriliruptorales bacterium]
MDFSPYDHESVGAAVDLVNSLGSISGRDKLDSPDAARRFLSEHGLPAPADLDERDVDELRALRERTRVVFEAGDAQSRAQLLNELLADALATPQLTDHDGHWHVHYAPADSSPATVVAAAAAMGLATVIAEAGHQRLGLCAADDCADVFIDASKNRSRRYCGDSCSSRTNVAAYRARQKDR